jgi:hypothetical protein
MDEDFQNLQAKATDTLSNLVISVGVSDFTHMTAIHFKLNNRAYTLRVSMGQSFAKNSS